MRIYLLLVSFLMAGAVCCQNYYLFIGTYTSTGSKGIYVYRFNGKSGKIQSVSNTEGIINPSYLVMAPDGKHLYACTESRTANAGSASAFAFNAEKGVLRFINKQPSGGDNPVYVSVHKTGKWVINGNYTGGSISAFPVNSGGSLQPFSQVIQHTGHSIHQERQDRPHVHAAVFSPLQDYVLVPDLGLDKIMVYHFEETSMQPLYPMSPSFVNTIQGSGPRHVSFHPNGQFVYLAEEMSGTVMGYRYTGGVLDSIQRIPAHEAGVSGPYGSADIHVSPDGRFLYVSNRGAENNIAIFAIEKTSGKLILLGYQPVMGEVPRNFIIDPEENFCWWPTSNQAT